MRIVLPVAMVAALAFGSSSPAATTWIPFGDHEYTLMPNACSTWDQARSDALVMQDDPDGLYPGQPAYLAVPSTDAEWSFLTSQWIGTDQGPFWLGIYNPDWPPASLSEGWEAIPESGEFVLDYQWKAGCPDTTGPYVIGDVTGWDNDSMTHGGDWCRFVVERVPEPGTLSLLAIGGFMLLRRR